jgi:hypothetical protein
MLPSADKSSSSNLIRFSKAIILSSVKFNNNLVSLILA